MPAPNLMDELIECRHKVAQLVLMDKVYLPIFERLEREITALETERALLERARAVIHDYRATA
jgi:hypothetical protein